MIETAIGGGVVVLVIGIISNRLFKKMDDLANNSVPKDVCTTRHNGLEKLIDEKFNAAHNKLDAIDKKLDKLNNVKTERDRP